MKIINSFMGPLSPHWTQVTTGGAYIRSVETGLHLGYNEATSSTYTDAQIDDYTMLSRSDYVWRPPLRMTVRARFSHNAATGNSTAQTKDTLRGTAGFGFWNKPFTMQGNWFTLPQAVWFFYSAPPSDMSLVPGQPGWGWKAQVINTTIASTATNSIPALIDAGRSRLGRAASGKALRRLTGANEEVITSDMKGWHTYVLEWHQHKVTFWVDNVLLSTATRVPSKPLGFVAWIDNEYAVVTSRGELRFGHTNSGAQWLDIASLKIENL